MGRSVGESVGAAVGAAVGEQVQFVGAAVGAFVGAFVGGAVTMGAVTFSPADIPAIARKRIMATFIVMTSFNPVRSFNRTH